MEQIAFWFGKIQPWHILAIGVVVALVIFVRKLQDDPELYGNYVPRGSDAACEDGDEGEVVVEEEEDPNVIVRIERAKSAEELVDIADEYNLVGTENDAFLRKALLFELTPDEWEDVYAVAEKGSELEKIAEGRAKENLAAITRRLQGKRREQA
jgi:hypothetical protein